MKSWQFFQHWEVNLLLVNNCISWMFLIIICLPNSICISWMFLIIICLPDSICIIGYCTRKLECGLKVEQSLAVTQAGALLCQRCTCDFYSFVVFFEFLKTEGFHIGNSFGKVRSKVWYLWKKPGSCYSGICIKWLWFFKEWKAK